jgi:hypothetical protein
MPVGDLSNKMICVRGIMPRCGTKFMGDVLACHPNVARFSGDFWEFPPFFITNPHQWRRLLPGENFRILCRGLERAATTLGRFLENEAGTRFSEQWGMVQFEELFLLPERVVNSRLSWCALSPETFDWEGF